MNTHTPSISLVRRPTVACGDGNRGDALSMLSMQGDGYSLCISQPRARIILAGQEEAVLLAPQRDVVLNESFRQTPAGDATVTTWTWTDPRGYVVGWTISQLKGLHGATLQMSFENRSSKSVQLREFHLAGEDETSITVPSISVQGRAQDWWLSTLDSHDSSVGGFNPSADLSAELNLKFLDTMTLYTDRGNRGLLLGAVGPAVSDVRFHCRVCGVGVGLKIVSEMNDVIVDPGENRVSEEVLIAAEPFNQAAQLLFRWLAATHGSRTARGALSGWCSWYDRGAKIDAKYIGQVIAKVRADRDRLPLDVIQIDDGWQIAYGDWRPDRSKFPDGMKVIAEQIRATGAIPGIWLCPVRSSSQGAHPDGQSNEYLDASHPAVKEFAGKALRDRVEEGFRYFKLDFLWVRDLKTRYERKKTRLEISRDIYRVYREAIGEDSYLLACVGGFNRGCFGFTDAARIGTDTSTAMKKLYAGCCLADCINATGSTALSNGVLFANDPDVTYLRFADRELLRTWYSYSGLLGGLMMTSEPLAELDAQSLLNLERFIPPAPNKGRAFDGQTDVWHRQFGFIATRPWGNFASIILWNPADHPADVALKGVPLEPLGPKFHAWSFWDEKYLGVVDETFVATALPAHASAQLRFTQLSSDRPVVVGSTFHVAMGSAEIGDIVTDAQSTMITLTDAGAREGKLYIHSPRPLVLVSASGCNARITRVGGDLYCAIVSDRQRSALNRINLKISGV